MSDLDRFVRKTQEQFIQKALEHYSEMVVGHWLHPRNLYAMTNPDGHACVKGPCGDTMEIFIRVRDGQVTGASFITDGCITSIASGSMAVTLALGKNLSEVKSISKEDILRELGGLPLESEHCATLAATTLREACAQL